MAGDHDARDRHLFGAGPKRLLSLDGGGVRGVISVAFLERIEAILSAQAGGDIRLGDWFDLIGGTSTGAIIAAGLALGHSAEEIRRFYEELAPKVFQTSRFRIFGIQAKFNATNLQCELDKIMGEYGVFSEGIRKSGHHVSGAQLHPTNAATTVRSRNGKVSTTDGPFAETKEQLGGFYLIEAKDLNDAIQVASKIPSAKFGSIEVRPIVDRAPVKQ